MDDDTLQTLAEATAGMSADDIAALIRSSSNADAFQDPDLVAAYLASRGGSD